MRKINEISIKLFFVIVAIVVMAGCKEDETTITPQFPELTERTVSVCETFDISFSTNLDWNIKSDRIWCNFKNGDFMETTASGKAGEQTLSIEISDESWNNASADVAQITLVMAGKEQVIYNITRTAKGYQDLVVKNTDGDILGLEAPLTVKGSGIRDVKSDSVFTLVTAMADAEVGIIEYPSWLNITNQGNGVFKLIFDKDNTGDISHINSFGTDLGYKLVFATEDHDAIEGNVVRKVEIPLAYEGLKAESISFTDEEEDGYPVKLYASADGSAFTYKAADGMTGEVVEENFSSPLQTSITARNSRYHVLVMGQTEDVAPNQTPYYTIDENADVSWLHIESNGSDLELSVDALSGEKRGAVVMAFSEDHWNAIQTDSLPEYGNSLVDAIFTKEEAYKSGEDIYYNYVVKNEYDANKWLDIFQEIEQITGGVTFNPYVYMNFGGEAMWLTFEDIIGMGSGLNPKLEDISGTPEAEELIANLGVSIPAVWKITCPNALTADANTCLAIQADGIEATDIFGAMFTPEGVTVGELQKDGKNLVSVVAPGYVGKIELIIMDTIDSSFKAALIIDVTSAQ